MKQGRWMVLALCLFSFARGVYGLGDQSLWWDESLSHYRATRPFSFILTNQILIPSGEVEIPSLDNHPPLYFVLLRAAVLAAGDGEFALRFLSTMAGVLVVPLLYLCGARLFDHGSGVLAALIGALSPFYLWYMQEARPYTLATWFGLLSFYALLRLLDDRARTARWGLGYALAVALMLTTHYHTFLLLPAQGAIWLASLARGRRRLGWVLAATLLIAGIVFVWGRSAMPPPSDASGYQFVPLPALLRDVLHAFTLGLSADALAGVRWAAIGLALTSTALLAAQRRIPRMHAVYVLIGLLTPIAAMFVLSLLRPAYLGSRHLMFASPFYYLLLAGGVAQARHIRLSRRLSLAWPFGATLAVVLAGMLVSNLAYRSDAHYAKEDHRGWGRYLSEHIRPDDGVLVVPAPIFDLYDYYVKTDAPHIGLPIFGHHMSKPHTVDTLTRFSQRYDRIWVAYSSTPGWANEDNLVLNWLETNARRASLVAFDSPTVVLQAHAFYTRLPVVDTLPPDAIALGLAFEDQLALLGARLPAQGVAAGRTLPLTLYWRVRQPLARDYRLTVALKDDDSLVWASMDTAPLQGAYPTTQWPVDGLVRDALDLELPPGIPPGRYQLSLSVYPQDGGAALAVRSPENGLLQGPIAMVGEIEIVSGGAFKDALPPGVARTLLRERGLNLLGYRCDAPVRLPGDVLTLNLYWQASRPLRPGRSIAVQLVDGRGEVVAERSYPVSTRYPPERWAVGELIWEQYRLRIPAAAAAGEYRLRLISDARSRSVELGAVSVGAAAQGRVFEAPSMQYALNLNFGDQIELLGYDLDLDAVQPGGVVSYTLYWRALEDVQIDYTVFNHLAAAGGQVWGQWDGQPQGGAMPTTRWVPGQVIADPYQISVAIDAPAGRLQPLVGLYDARTMLRLPLRDAQGNVSGDHATLAEVSVQNK